MPQRDASGRFTKGGGDDAGGLSGLVDDAGGLAGMLGGASDGLAKMGTALDKVGSSAQQAGGGLAKMQTSSGGASSGVSKLVAVSEKARAAIVLLGAAVVSVFTGAIPTATQAGASLGSAIGGALTGAADKAADALGKLGPAGQVAGAALQVMATGASVTIGVLLTLSGVAIDVVQKLDMMRARFGALAGGAAAGRQVQAMVEGLGKSLPFATEQIGQWAQSLLAAGMRGKGLEESIKAVAAATAIMGESGGAAAQDLLSKLAEGGEGAKKLLKQIQEGGPKSNKLLAEMGLSTHDLASAMGMSDAAFKTAKLSADQMNTAIVKALQKKGAGPLEDMALSLPVILGKAREGLLSLFDALGPSVKILMKEVKSFFAELSKGGGVIVGLKPTFTAVFSAIFGWLTRVMKGAHEILQGFMGTKGAKGPLAEIGASLRKITDSVVLLISTFGRLNKGSQAGGLSSALKLLAWVVGAVADSIIVMVDNATMALAILGALGDAANSVGSYLSGLADEASAAASNIIDGLVGGLDPAAFVAKMAGMAQQGLSAFKAVLGIASKSKVLLKHGEQDIAGAAAAGVDKGGDKMDAAMEGLGGGRPAARAGKKGGGGDRVFAPQFTNCTFGAISKAELWDWLEQWWEMQSAAGPEPEPAS